LFAAVNGDSLVPGRLLAGVIYACVSFTKTCNGKVLLAYGLISLPALQTQEAFDITCLFASAASSCITPHMSQHLGNVHITHDKRGLVSLMHAVTRFSDVTTASFDQQWLYEDATNQV